ncbi:hypothetical protein BY458DRAFT_496081 [Sporodiniella umbellata]|nr:hypothetical protein BY458DRAFT_496081 [Sporodiniella umbellata]
MSVETKEVIKVSSDPVLEEPLVRKSNDSLQTTEHTTQEMSTKRRGLFNSFVTKPRKESENEKRRKGLGAFFSKSFVKVNQEEPSDELQKEETRTIQKRQSLIGKLFTKRKLGSDLVQPSESICTTEKVCHPRSLDRLTDLFSKKRKTPSLAKSTHSKQELSKQTSQDEEVPFIAPVMVVASA